jgi:parvulin-like peptidyl-prolyl isomerase
MTVPAEAIEEQLRVARSQFSSEEEFLAYLHEAGTTTDDLRREARRRLLMEAYASTVTEGLEADATRARALYDERAEQFREKAQRRVAQILVRLRPGDSEERRAAARKKIDEAWSRAVAGEDFAALAREYSESPLAERGGDMGFFPRGRMLPEFEDVVFATQVGEITPVFETPHGFNVVKVLDRKEARVRSFEEVKTGLMLVLTRDKKDQALHDHVEELVRQAEIKIVDPTLN